MTRLLWLLALPCLLPRPALAQQALAGQRVCPQLPPPSVTTDSVAQYVWSLPSVLCRAIAVSDSLADSAETTYSMVLAARPVIDSLRPILYRLAAFYQNWGDTTALVVDAALQARFRWVSFTTQPDGFGLSGTMTQVTGTVAAGAAVADMVSDLVDGLLGNSPDFAYDEWYRRWTAAGRSRHEVDPQ